VAVPLGLAAGMRPGSAIDRVARGVGLAGQTIPSFWLGMLFILLFAVTLRWLPSFGRDGLASLVLPAIALGFAGMGQLVRLTRSAVLDVRRADYVRTAHAKGLARGAVMLKHALRNGLIPVMSVLGLQFAGLMGGAIITESIFALPGIGRLSIEALAARDVPVVQGVVLLAAGIIVLSNLIVDLGYSLVDPRIRYG